MREIISKEGIENLLAVTEENLNQREKEIGGAYEILKDAQKVRTIVSKFEKKEPYIILINRIEKVIEYRMLLGMFILDLTTATRIYLHSTSPYEKLYSARQIYIILNEAFKKIYNFITYNKDGSENETYRNNSFWVKYIKEIVQDIDNLNKEYNEITVELEAYHKDHFSDIKEVRDMSIHYDKQPTKVYQMLINLDPERTLVKMLPFIKILNQMFDFTQKIPDTYKNGIVSFEAIIRIKENK